ncbi:MAG: HAMP domain-containing protein [Chloroflexi bacterium]|nr:HAMP domain-containing protein [Chloroflexota bacterium]
MPIRTRLFTLALLFVTAVALNIFALVYLTRSVSNSLGVIERVRERQLTASQMDAHLRDAEAALYRYQFEGERGFADQFWVKINLFAEDIQRYQALADDPTSRNWALLLDQSRLQAEVTGRQLIDLRDSQTIDLQTFLDQQVNLTDLLLNTVKPARSDDAEYQSAVTGMYEASRAMLTSVTLYVASPDETKRGQFTEAAVSLSQNISQFSHLAQTDQEKEWLTQLQATSLELQRLGSQLIGARDLQQSQFANFISIVFNAGQQTIVGKIQPHEVELLNQAQQSVQDAVRTATIISVGLPVLMTLIAGLLVYRLTQQMNVSIDALLSGADRVAGGDLRTAVNLTGRDELSRLADSFNRMMDELLNREDRLRAMIGRMAQIQDEERRLIGLDLHDGLIQLVISANMHLNALNALSSSRLEPSALQELDVSRSLVKQSIDEARKVIAELRPTVVEDFGLEEGLRRYVSEICEAHHWSYEIITEINGLEIAPSVQTAIFRIAQEAISNVSKHAQTQRVRVELSEDGQNLSLSVQDWGRGFEPSELGDESPHVGLVSIQERAGMLGGVSQIHSKVGEGTLVEVKIPRAALAGRSNDVEK